MARGRMAPRRKTQWAGFGDNSGAAALPVFVTAAVGTPVIISRNMIATGSAGLIDEEVTITRMIGRFNAFIDEATRDAEASVAVGCAVARNEAITAGVASLPSPEDDPDFEWLFYTVLALHNGFTGLDTSDLSHVYQDFDVRGQRLVRAGQSVVWIAESQTTACEFQVGGRYLVKLP